MPKVLLLKPMNIDTFHPENKENKRIAIDTVKK